MSEKARDGAKDFIEDLSHDPEFMRLVRNLCPKPGGGVSEITFSVPGGKAVTLTSDTRKQINQRLRQENPHA